MELTLCDLCPRSALSEATFRIEFQRIGGVGGMTDPSIDVCKKHYDKIYETTVTSTP